MNVGFTGTQKGMTQEQQTSLVMLLTHLRRFDGSGDPEFWHGDCIGADTEATKIAQSLRYSTRAWPGPDPLRRGHLPSNYMHEPLDFMQRNRIIAASCNPLVACPSGFQMQQRSGTWATVRFARQNEKTVYVIWPDGKIDKEWVGDMPGRLIQRHTDVDIDLRKDRL